MHLIHYLLNNKFFLNNKLWRGDADAEPVPQGPGCARLAHYEPYTDIAEVYKSQEHCHMH